MVAFILPTAVFGMLRYKQPASRRRTLKLWVLFVALGTATVMFWGPVHDRGTTIGDLAKKYGIPVDRVIKVVRPVGRTHEIAARGAWSGPRGSQALPGR